MMTASAQCCRQPRRSANHGGPDAAARAPRWLALPYSAARDRRAHHAVVPALQQAGAELPGAFRRRVDVRYPEAEMGLLRTARGRPATGTPALTIRSNRTRPRALPGPASAHMLGKSMIKWSQASGHGMTGRAHGHRGSGNKGIACADVDPAAAWAFTGSYRETRALEKCKCPAPAIAGTALVTALATACFQATQVTRACACTTRFPGGPGGSGCDSWGAEDGGGA
jgi:hypothetical protein